MSKLHPIGPTSPTRPVGDSSNAIATTAFVLANAGGASGSLISVKSVYGAKGDVTVITPSNGGTVAITSGTPTLVVSTAAFTTADIGKMITVPGAGAAGASLRTTIAGRTSATTITLGVNASTTVAVTWVTADAAFLAKRICYGTDDTAAFVAAFASQQAIYVPPGIYATTGLLINNSYTRVLGAGRFQSSLMCFQNNSSVLSIAALVGRVELDDFAVDRAGAPISGGNGINFNGYVDDCRVSRLWVRNQFIGAVFSGTGFSRVEECNITESLSHNFYFSNPPSGPGFQSLQWQVIDNYSAAGGGSSYIVATVVGPPGVTMGEWINNASFGSTGYDMAFIGLAACPINAVRITGGFVGGSGNSGLLLDTYAGLHRILNLYCEYAGTGTTGPGLATPASGIGSGFEISATNTDVILINPSATHNSQDGIRNSASASLTIVGGRMSSNTLYGARLNDGAKATITGMAFDLNTSGPIFTTTNPNSLAVLNCLPATVDRLILPAWTSYTPTQSGAAGGTPSGWYQILGKTMAISLRFAATGGGTVTLSIPAGFTASATIPQAITGRDNGASGKMLVGTIGGGGTTFSVSLYDGSASGAAAGAFLDLTGTFQIA